MIGVGVGGAVCAAQSDGFVFGFGVTVMGLGADDFVFVLMNRLRLICHSCVICSSRLVHGVVVGVVTVVVGDGGVGGVGGVDDIAVVVVIVVLVDIVVVVGGDVTVGIVGGGVVNEI